MLANAMVIPTEKELVTRAMRAYFTAGKVLGGADQPSNESGVEQIEGKDYVVLRNVRGVLAVYQIRNDGGLKRLSEWPAEIE